MSTFHCRVCNRRRHYSTQRLWKVLFKRISMTKRSRMSGTYMWLYSRQVFEVFFSTKFCCFMVRGLPLPVTLKQTHLLFQKKPAFVKGATEKQRSQHLLISDSPFSPIFSPLLIFLSFSDVNHCSTVEKRSEFSTFSNTLCVIDY